MPIIGIDWKDEDARCAAAGWQQLGNPYERIGTDHDGRVAIDWGVYGAPESFLISPTGTVVYKQIGAMTPQVWQREFLPRIGAAAVGAAGRIGEHAAVRGARAHARTACAAAGTVGVRRRRSRSTTRRRCPIRCCSSAISRSRTSCAACSARTRRWPIPRWAWPRICASRCAICCWPGRRDRSDPRSHGGALRRVHPVSAAHESGATPGCGARRRC